MIYATLLGLTILCTLPPIQSHLHDDLHYNILHKLPSTPKPTNSPVTTLVPTAVTTTTTAIPTTNIDTPIRTKCAVDQVPCGKYCYNPKIQNCCSDNLFNGPITCSGYITPTLQSATTVTKPPATQSACTSNIYCGVYCITNPAHEQVCIYFIYRNYNSNYHMLTILNC